MNKTDPAPITELLAAWSAGDGRAADRVTPLVYDQLRSIARGYFRRERGAHTLQATALVHEAFVRLSEQTGVRWRSRAHFVGLMAHVMRRVLVDYARERNTARRGGKALKMTLLEADGSSSDRDLDVMALDEALRGLAKKDPRKARIVELRFFGGLSIDETAEVLAVAPRTVIREWRRARAWLYRQLATEAQA